MKQKKIARIGMPSDASRNQRLDVTKSEPKEELPRGMHNVIDALAPIRKRIEKKYGGILPYKIDLADCIIAYLGQGATDLSFLKGKRYLELGCGSNLADIGQQGKRAPWLCRYLQETGLLAEVVGIDQFEQRGEEFTGHKKDLLEHRALDFLKSGSFHFVVSNKLIEFVGDIGDDNTDSVLRSKRARVELEAMREELLGQIARVLKEGGLFCTNNKSAYAVFQKQGGKLVRIQ